MKQKKTATPIVIRVTEEEREALKKAAAEKGLSVSAYILQETVYKDRN